MDISPVIRKNKIPSSRLHGQFKSPVLVRDDKSGAVKSPATPSPSTSNKKEHYEMQMAQLHVLKQNCAEMEKQIEILTQEGIKESHLETHISKLHEYNEIKDVTQMVLGQLAVLEGVTVAELHRRYNLNLKE